MLVIIMVFLLYLWCHLTFNDDFSTSGEGQQIQNNLSSDKMMQGSKHITLNCESY